ncbi:MAG TPA: selenide, water dikinase SelD [Solirubrobacteraceae bacterium]|jgi:selenide,water dikinase
MPVSSGSNLAASPLLTALSHAGGCGRKLAAIELVEMLTTLPTQLDARLLVDASSRDDAAVIDLDRQLALVFSVDFFTPLVDDPRDFGRIAAANALSDIYAMGATPLAALNIVGFPSRTLGDIVLAEILRGGAEVVVQAGAFIAGGHTINDDEPKYGLAVIGLVDPGHMTTNAAGQPGDELFLSKPLGTGAIVTARRHGHLDDELLASAVETMVQLNERAASDALQAGVRAMTDITGYGLLGHLHNLCESSGLAAQLEAEKVPVLAGVQPLLEDEIGISSGTRGNLEWAAGFAEIDESVEPWRARLLADATTSGGLLAAVPQGLVSVLPGWRIGQLQAGKPGAIAVH